MGEQKRPQAGERCGLDRRWWIGLQSGAGQHKALLALPGDRATKNFFESFGLKARLLTVHAPL